MEKQTIVGLTVQNIQRLHAVSIRPDPDGSLVIIGGENEQGKSSLLDSIEMALAGKDAISQVPIHKGESKAQIVLETQDLRVTRNFTAGGSTLVVTGKDGKTKYSSPQTLLDGLVSAVSFDPLAFATMDDTKRAEQLRRLVGLDFSAIDTEKQELYDERTGVNRDVAAARGKVMSLTHHADAPAAVLSAEALQKEYEEAVQLRASNKALRESVPTFEADLERAEALVTEADEDIASIEAELKKAKEIRRIRGENVTAKELLLAEQKAAVANIQEPDVDAISTKLTTIAEQNKKHDENEARASWQKKLDRLEEQSRQLTESIDGLEAQKSSMLKRAKFPVEKLSFNDSGVTYDEVPFDQASTAAKLKISVAMGLALNPTLKVLLIRRGSDLDKRNLALVATMAKEAGAQVWVERVGEGEEVQVIIEDGRVKENRISPTTK